MVITDKFVFIHMPKTGGTFVTTMLKKAHGFKRTGQKPSGFVEQWLGRGWRGLLDIKQHGTCRDIPKRHREKTIVATIRNPYDRYVSQYEFKWWLKYPDSFGDPAMVKARFPTFPDLSFGEYVALTNTFLAAPAREREKALGWHSTQFVKFFSRDPESAVRRVHQGYSGSEDYRRDFFPTRFLHTDRLNEELHAFLREMGYPPERIAPILGSEKVFPREGGRTEDQTWEKYFTPELKQFVRTREWMLFELFPEFDA